MRRIVLLCLVAFLMVGSGTFAGTAHAQASTPTTADFNGYPLLTVTVTADAYVLDVATVPAGLVVVAVTNSTEDSVEAVVVGPAPGQTAAELIAAAAVPPAAPGQLAPFLYEATLPGGPITVPAGETREQLMLLPAGDWGVLGADGQAPGIFATVDGDGSRTDAPKAGVTVAMSDNAFGGFEQAVPAGPTLWNVTTTGKQPHSLMLVGVPAGTELADLPAMFGMAEAVSGRPTAADLTEVTDGVSLQSNGQSLWMPMTLEPGTYAAICFVPDATTGKTHAEAGMVALFTVA
jgi:hypothetical protein